MDPNATLQEQRQIVAIITQIQDTAQGPDGTFTEEEELALVGYACRLAELQQALDQWLSQGGFLPTAWRHVADQTPHRILDGLARAGSPMGRMAPVAHKPPTPLEAQRTARKLSRKRAKRS